MREDRTRLSVPHEEEDSGSRADDTLLNDERIGRWRQGRQRLVKLMTVGGMAHAMLAVFTVGR